MKSTQIYFTPAAGKKLIADALASLDEIRDTMMHHTVVVLKGSTNGYLAEALASQLEEAAFDKKGFYRGLLKAPGCTAAAPQQPYDMVIEKGKLIPEKTIFDVADSLGAEDIIFKGANAVHLESGTAGVLIGDSRCGTILACESAAVGRRVRLIHPVGLEKRVELPMPDLASICNNFDDTGLRLFPSTGIPYTELDALSDLFGVTAEIMAAGGVCGYEGGCLLRCEGEVRDIDELITYAKTLQDLPPYQI